MKNFRVPLSTQIDSQQFDWEIPTRIFQLNKNEVHVWKYSLGEECSEETYQTILSPEEISRAERLKTHSKQRHFKNAHIALRKTLSNYLKIPPGDVNFGTDAQGKPFIDHPQNEIRFNLSHSSMLMVAAISRVFPVGIDVERRQRISAKDQILNQYFSKNDQAKFNIMPESVKNAAFLRAWTIKEAYEKALGTGISSSSKMDFTDFDLPADIPQNYFKWHLKNKSWFLLFSPQDSYMATAVALSDFLPGVKFILGNT